MTAPAEYSSLLPLVPAGSSIPKCIYQVFHTKTLPPPIQRNIASIRALNPAWDYQLLDDDGMVKFIGEVYGPTILAYYTRINRKYGAARADLFRYLLIYAKGGVYIDIKGTFERCLDEVIRRDDVYLLSRWRNGKGEEHEGWGTHKKLESVGGHEFQQWHIAAAPGHPFLRAVIETVLRNIDNYNPISDGTGRIGVLSLTGPIAYTLAIMGVIDKGAYRMAEGKQELGFVYSIFSLSKNDSHGQLFKHHYTKLDEPIVRLHGVPRISWLIYGPLNRYIILRVRHAFQAVMRRVEKLREFKAGR